MMFSLPLLQSPSIWNILNAFSMSSWGRSCTSTTGEIFKPQGDPDKVQAIKDLRRFLSMSNFNNCFLPKVVQYQATLNAYFPGPKTHDSLVCRGRPGLWDSQTAASGRYTPGISSNGWISIGVAFLKDKADLVTVELRFQEIEYSSAELQYLWSWTICRVHGNKVLPKLPRRPAVHSVNKAHALTSALEAEAEQNVPSQSPAPELYKPAYFLYPARVQQR